MKPWRKSALDFCLVLGGKASISAVIFLGGVLLARASGPAEYAMFSVAISAVLLCDGMIGAPLDMAAVRFTSLHAGERNRTERFEAMAMQLKLLLVAALFLVSLGVRLLFSDGLSHSAVRSFPFVPCLLATVCLLVARSVGVGLQIRRRFRVYSLVDVTQGIVRLLGFVILAPLGLARSGAYILAYGLAGLFAAFSGIAFCGQKYLLGSWPAGLDSRRLLRYCGYSAGIVACGTLTGRGDILVLAMAGGSEKLSSYGLASQMAMVLGQIALYASVLTAPEVILLARTGALRRLFASNVLLVLAVIPIACVALHPVVLQWAAHIVFGKGMACSIPVLQILLCGAIIDLLIVPVLMSYCVQACPAQAFWGEVIITCGLVPAAIAAATGRLPWAPEQSMACVAFLARLAKLALYGRLFAVHTSPRAVAALACESHTGTPALQS